MPGIVTSHIMSKHLHEPGIINCSILQVVTLRLREVEYNSSSYGRAEFLNPGYSAAESML